MSTIAQLQKQANAGPKFILAAYYAKIQNYVYAGDTSKGHATIVADSKKATQYSVDFDNEEIKEKAFDSIAKIMKLDLKFIAIPA